MIGNVARGVFSRCLPVLVVVLLAVAGLWRGLPAERVSGTLVGDAVTASVVADRTRVLTAQNTAAAGASRAPPVTAA
ncbi:MULTISPECIES: hypothetical protein [Actinoplanes]|nr:MULTISPECIES: hypothetical protein [Actinoplanes]